MPLELVTIVHRSWDFPISDFVLPLHEDPDGQLRKDLAVTGVSDSAGFLIAYPEVDFDPADDGFQVYFHGIVTGAKIKALQNLRKAAGYDGASLTNPLIFDSNVNHEHLQEADVDSSFVAARAEPRKTETWPPTRGNDDTAPN